MNLPKPMARMVFVIACMNPFVRRAEGFGLAKKRRSRSELGFRVAEPEQYAAVMAMIPLAEGKPLVRVGRRDGCAFVCRRVSGLHVAPEEWAFRGECDWLDPPDARPDDLAEVMEISCGDCLGLGPGWWFDSYFGWVYVYDPGLVARSLAGDHSWVPGFLGYG